MISVEFLPSAEEEMEMKAYMFKGLGIVVLLGMLIALGDIKDPEAGVQDKLAIKLPLPVTLHGRYPIVDIPETYVYFVSDIDVSILFYEGYWYRSCDDNWFWAESYNGPWAYIKPSEVPRSLIKLPPGYRQEFCG